MNAASLLPILGELLAKSTVILLLATLIVRLWPGATAAQRHFVWLAAIVTLLLLPATRLFTPRWPIPLQRKAITQLPDLAGPAVPIRFPATMPAPLPPVPHPTTHRLPDWRKLLIRGWLGGVAFLLGYRLLGMRRLHRLKQSCARLRDERIQHLASAVFFELKIKHHVDVHMAEGCHVPMTWGGVHSVLLLPAEAVSWSDSRVRAALRHEAGHILHRDYLVRWLASVAAAFYWPNPLIWLAIRSLRSAQEQAIDDLVLRAGTPPDEYATQLFETARTVGTRGLFARHAVAMANPSTLEARVVAILDGRRARRPLGRRTAIIGSLVIAGTLALCEAAQLQGAEQSPTTPAEGTDLSGAAESKSAEPASSPAAARDISADPTLELSPIRMEEVADEQSARRFVLHIPIKLRPGKRVDVNDLVIHVLFYDLIDGQTVVQTAANVSIHWIKPPADWTKGDTEELAVEYQLPKSQAVTHDGGPRQYFGYIVRVYYQGHLQAADADPLRLTQQYPPPARLPASDTVQAQESAGDVFTSAYMIMIEGEKLEKQNHLEEARDRMQKAAQLLTKIAKTHPEWQPHIMEYRQTRVREAIQRLTVAIDTQGKVNAAPMPLPVDGAVQTKAMSIILDKIEMRDVKIAEAVKLLHDKSVESDPDKRGVNIFLLPDVPTDATITLSLSRVPLIEAVKYAAGLIYFSPFYSKEGIVIGSSAPPGPAYPAAAPLITREWNLPRGVISTPNHDAREWLTAHGVKFPPAASAAYMFNRSKLLMRNTQDQLDLVDQLVAKASEHLPPANTPEGAAAATTPAIENPMLDKAAAIIIPKIEFKDATVPEALDFLRKKAAEFDPQKTGINIICQPGAASNTKLTLSVANLPLIEALRYVAGLADLDLVAQPHALVLRAHPPNSIAPGVKP